MFSLNKFNEIEMNIYIARPLVITPRGGGSRVGELWQYNNEEDHQRRKKHI